jgi:hypothetical protein
LGHAQADHGRDRDEGEQACRHRDPRSRAEAWHCRRTAATLGDAVLVVDHAHALASLALTVGQDSRVSPEYYTVGPGFAAFVVTFLLAVSLWLLYRSFSKKVRKQRLEQQRREGLASEQGSRVEESDGGRDEVAGETSDR